MKIIITGFLLLSSFSTFGIDINSTNTFNSKIVCDSDFGKTAESCDVEIQQKYPLERARFKNRLVKHLKQNGYSIVGTNASFIITTDRFGYEAPGYSDLWNSIEIKDNSGARCIITSITPNESNGRMLPAIAKSIWFGARATRAALNLLPVCE